MLTNPKLSRSSKFEMGRTKKEEMLEAMGKNPEKSFLELPRLCRQLKILHESFETFRDLLKFLNSSIFRVQTDSKIIPMNIE